MRTNERTRLSHLNKEDYLFVTSALLKKITTSGACDIWHCDIATQHAFSNERLMKRLLFRLATAIVILYPVISDRVMRTLDYECVFLPDKNPVFVVAMAFVGHHIPCVVIVVCYAVVYYEIRRLVKTRPQYRVDPARSVVPLKIRPDISRYRPVASALSSVLSLLVFGIDSLPQS